MYAHKECVSHQLIPISHGVTQYDLSYEQLCKLPQRDQHVWKYHGGLSQLPFGVMDTVQGLCLNVYRESLHDRRIRIDELRTTQSKRKREELDEQPARDEAYNIALSLDDVRDTQAKQRRLQDQAPRKALHLEPLLQKYPTLPTDIVEAVRELYYSNLSLPLAWKHLDSALHAWTYKQFQVTPEERKRVFSERPRSVLDPLQWSGCRILGHPN